MSEPLPVVQKAQRYYVGKLGDLYPSEVCSDKWLVYAFKEKDIERERAGYEKREQALKQKIREIVGLLEKDILYRSHHPKFKWIAGSNTLKARNELLGLSKQ